MMKRMVVMGTVVRIWGSVRLTGNATIVAIEGPEIMVTLCLSAASVDRLIGSWTHLQTIKPHLVL